LIIGLSISPFGHLPSSWRQSGELKDLSFEGVSAQALSADLAGLDFVVLTDRRGVGPVDGLSPDTVPFEPSTLLAALATMARHIGLVAAASMRQHEPYNLARRFGSVDQISRGRSGWLIPSAEDFARDKEYVSVVRELWDSWDDDAFLYDKASGRFFDPQKMHVANHHGLHFSVRGPLNVNRSPQGRPVICQALTHETRVPAAHWGELVFLQETSEAALAETLTEFRRTIEAVGRRRGELRLLANIMPFVVPSPEAREAVIESMRSENDVGAQVLIGNPEEIAASMERLMRVNGLDGFTLLPPTKSDAQSFLNEVVPLLKRKIVTDEVKTLRDRVGLTRPALTSSLTENAL